MTTLDRKIIDVIKSNNSPLCDILTFEQERQDTAIELIASENFPSERVRALMASNFTCKYTEGYPAVRTSGRTGRYYGGCEYYDILEEYCCKKWKEVFQTDYHVNVQPHSGSQANFAAYMSILNPGDTILSMNLSNGAHLTHGSPVNFSGKLYNIIFYNTDSNGFIDMNDVREKALQYHPKLIVAGASAYSRKINYKEFKDICNEIGCYFMVDMAHVAGIIAANTKTIEKHPSPFGYADIITTTTHKTLRGPRGGLIFSTKELANKVDSAVFPCSQGGPLQNIIAAKAATAEEALTPEFRTYIIDVLLTANSMAKEFKKMGYDIVTGGTENHMFLIDFSNTHPWLSGKALQEELDKHKITLNKNCVPNEKRSPVQTSGVRIGTPAMCTKGYKELDFIRVAHQIDDIIKSMNH